MVHAMSHAVSENLKWPRAHSPAQPCSALQGHRAGAVATCRNRDFAGRSGPRPLGNLSINKAHTHM